MKIQETNESYEFQTEKQRKSKGKFKNKVKWIKFITLLVLFLILAILLAVSPAFNITKAEVEGCTHYKSDQIIAATDIIIGNNGFKTIGKNIINIALLRYNKAEKDILKSFPYIKQAKVSYILPGRFKITLIERKPVGVIPCLGTNLVADSEGFVLEAIPKTDNIKLPIIKGMKLQRYELGQKLKPDNPDCFSATTRLIQKIVDSDSLDSGGNLKLADLISYIDASDINKICVDIDSRIVVNFGNINDNDIDYEIRFLRQIYVKSIKKEDKGYLDFTSGDNPSFRPD